MQFRGLRHSEFRSMSAVLATLAKREAQGHRGRAERLDGREAAHEDVVLHHGHAAHRQGDRHAERDAVRDRCHGERHADLEMHGEHV